MQNEQIAQLKQWMAAKGVFIHDSIEVPSSINGVQGISSKKYIPPKTLIMAIPQSIIITVQKCYNDPTLKRLFNNNDQLFDYEESQDSEFNILCVFMMYHKIHIHESPWKQYFSSISQPETGIDWKNSELKGLNKSMIEEIIHVRRQCEQLETQIVNYLLKRKQFAGIQQSDLRSIFKYCYKAVMTHSFGYYFDQTCLIPIADLINHGCEAVDHQLLHLHYENGNKVPLKYKYMKKKIDCSLLGLQKPDKVDIFYRHKALIEKGLLKENQQMGDCDRDKVDEAFAQWNKKLIKEDPKTRLEDLQFQSQDQAQDNDTDEQAEAEQQRNLKHFKKVEQKQMQEFRKHLVQIQMYKDIEIKLENNQGGDPIQEIKDSSSDSSSSYSSQQEMEWGLKDGTFFTMYTLNAIAPNKEIFNSYGSRSNKFLLIWYGFTYPNNLFDSVTFRLHIKFTDQLRPASQTVIDSYIGGQGLSFRKNENEMVQDTELSKQFRLKRNNIPLNLIMFLRLYLLNFYTGQDLYKLMVTHPSSLDFQIFMLNYAKDIIESMYERFPQKTLKELKQEYEDTKNYKTKFKIVYITEQLQLLDLNKEAISAAIRILKKCKQQNTILKQSTWNSEKMQVIRMIRKYLIQVKKCEDYIKYQQKEQCEKNEQPEEGHKEDKEQSKEGHKEDKEQSKEGHKEDKEQPEEGHKEDYKPEIKPQMPTQQDDDQWQDEPNSPQ